MLIYDLFSQLGTFEGKFKLHKSVLFSWAYLGIRLETLRKTAKNSQHSLSVGRDLSPVPLEAGVLTTGQRSSVWNTVTFLKLLP
jgi:hypothetical protein